MAGGKIDLDLILNADALRDEIDRAEGFFAKATKFNQYAQGRGQIRNAAGFGSETRSTLNRNVMERGGFQSLAFGRGSTMNNLAGRHMGTMSMGGMFRGAMGAMGGMARGGMMLAGGMGGALMHSRFQQKGGFSKGMEGGAKLANLFAQLGTETKGLIQLFNRNTKALQKFTKGLAGGIGRGAMRAGGALAGGLMGFATGAFREGIGNYQSMGNAQLAASAVMGPGGRFANSAGASMGYNAAEMAGIQATGAKAGLGRGKGAGKSAAILSRAMEGGIEFGGGIMRRQGMSGNAGQQSMFSQLSKAFQLAVRTGLDSARITEFMQAGNELAERQIAITPDIKGAFNEFTTEMARLQSTGSGGLSGKYAGQALSRVHGAIQGASGVQQQFQMRAFGFGKGASLMDVMKRQEQGATGANISSIMKQLQGEYGAGKGGGLSDAGKMAFKGMGFGSISMSEKFSQAYLDHKGGKIDKGQFEKKVQEINDEAKSGNLPSIQKRAYANINKFGTVAVRFAERFNRMAADGAKWFSILQNLDKMQKTMVGLIRPIMEEVKKAMPTLVKLFQSLAPILGKGIAEAIKGISLIAGLISGFFKGAKNSNTMWGAFSGGIKGASDVYDKMGGYLSKPVEVNGQKASDDALNMRSSLLYKMAEIVGMVKSGGVGINEEEERVKRHRQAVAEAKEKLAKGTVYNDGDGKGRYIIQVYLVGRGEVRTKKL